MKHSMKRISLEFIFSVFLYLMSAMSGSLYKLPLWLLLNLPYRSRSVLASKPQIGWCAPVFDTVCTFCLCVLSFSARMQWWVPKGASVINIKFYQKSSFHSLVFWLSINLPVYIYNPTRKNPMVTDPASLGEPLPIQRWGKCCLKIHV